jgi:hypothetical protein
MMAKCKQILNRSRSEEERKYKNASRKINSPENQTTDMNFGDKIK